MNDARVGLQGGHLREQLLGGKTLALLQVIGEGNGFRQAGNVLGAGRGGTGDADGEQEMT